MAEITDLKQAYDALSNKLLPYQTAMNYYDGDQPTVYSTERLRDAFGNINARFVQNWIAVVVNAVLDRLSLNGWDAQDKAVNDTLDNAWNDLRIFIDADEVHKDALVTGEGFIIAWKEGDVIDVYRNDPRMCHMFYDPDRPKEKRFAAKWWHDGAAWHMTLYYPDRLEYYVTGRTKNKPASATAFKPAEVERAPNPFGVIPVFHFSGDSELQSITDLQDAVNKLFADMMVAAEYGAFKQRWIISNSDTSALKNAPNEIWEIPAGDGTTQGTAVGQFDATDLDNFLASIDKIANSIAIISRTPKHYFFTTGGDPSGEALLAMEAPLTKKAHKKQKRFGVVWQELGAFLEKLSGGAEVRPADITPVWEPAQSIQPLTEAQTTQANVTAGIPLVTTLKRQGWSETDIQAMLKDAKEAEAKQTSLAQAMLAQARVESEQSNQPVNGNQLDQEQE